MNFLSLLKRKIIYRFKKKISIDNDDIHDESLDKLFYLYGSDKANLFKIDNSQGHGFSKYYVQHLEKKRNQKLNILEVGSFSGASAAAFKKYFPKSRVFCFDVNISKFKYSSKKIEVHGLDINNKEKVKNTLKNIFLKYQFENFDFIIDDGSHKLSDILFSLNFFFKVLKPGGIFVIEDFKHPNYFHHYKDIEDIFIDELIDKISKKEFFNSSILKQDDQKYLFSSIDSINVYKGNLQTSDICFISKI